MTNDSAVKAIATRYAGCHFRSRLEARWAVFFDQLGIRWEHEAEGYETPAGRYLPDFLLHLREPTLFEVKPESGLGAGDERWEHMPYRLVVAYGMPRLDQLQPSDQPGYGQLHSGDPHLDENGRRCGAAWDSSYAFCVCPWCGAVGIEFDGRGGRVCGHDAHSEGWVTYGPERQFTAYQDKMYNYDHPRLVAAYNAARSARFEHGESGRS